MEKKARRLKVGDWVEAMMMGRLWGEGEVMEISTTSHGGSRLYPAFRIESADGDEAWFPMISLTRVGTA